MLVATIFDPEKESTPVWNSDEIQDVLTHVRAGMGMCEDVHYLALANVTVRSPTPRNTL